MEEDAFCVVCVAVLTASLVIFRLTTPARPPCRKPEDPDAGMVIELKYAATFLELDGACEKAMQQIGDRRYDEALRNDGRENILAYGIAFCKKRCKVVCEKL